MILLSALGSGASILGLAVSLYVLFRENRIEDELVDLIKQEKKRYDQ